MWALVLCSVMTLVFMDESCEDNQMTYSVWQMGRQKAEWRRRWSFIALSPACLHTSCMLPWWPLSNSEISCTTPWNGKPQRDGRVTYHMRTFTALVCGWGLSIAVADLWFIELSRHFTQQLESHDSSGCHTPLHLKTFPLNFMGLFHILSYWLVKV
jgi:hypothetical protein